MVEIVAGEKIGTHSFCWSHCPALCLDEIVCVLLMLVLTAVFVIQ